MGERLEGRQSANSQESVREFDINKGWREQLTETEVRKIKNWAEKVVQQWHDEIKPDYVFLTETSAIPYGYVLKETWETAYKDKSLPKFLRIDPKLVESFLNEQRISTGKDQAFLSQVKEYFNKVLDKNNPIIIVFDEGAIIDNNSNPDSYDFIHSYNEGDEESFNVASSSRSGGISDRSLRLTMDFLRNIIHDKKSSIWGSQQVVKEILIGEEEDTAKYRERLTNSKLIEALISVCQRNGFDIKDYWSRNMHPETRKKVKEEALRTFSFPLGGIDSPEFQTVFKSICDQRGLDYQKVFNLELGGDVFKEIEKEAYDRIKWSGITPELKVFVEGICEEKGLNPKDFWDRKYYKLEPEVLDEALQRQHYQTSGYKEGKLSRKMTSKSYQSRDRYGIHTEDMVHKGIGEFGGKISPSLRGFIASYPGQVKRSLKYIKDLRELGKEAGLELRTKLNPNEA